MYRMVKGALCRPVRHLRPASPSLRALRPIWTARSTPRTGWAVLLSWLLVSPAARGGQAEPHIDFLDGEQGLALPAGAAEQLAEPGALDRLLGRSFGRIEVFRGDDLLRVVAVARSEGSASELGAIRASLAAARGPASEPPATAEPAPAMSLADAVALAKDAGASPDERQRAVAALAASGATAAVDALRGLAAAESGTDLGRMAVLGLGRFAGTEAEAAAAEALGEISRSDQVAPVDLFRARAAYDMTPLIADFQATDDTRVRYRKLQAAANSTDWQGLTDFYLAALQDPSSDIVRTAAMDMGRLADGLDPGRVVSALEWVAANHRSRSAREGAAIGLRYARTGGPALDPGPNFDPALHGGAPPSNGGGRGPRAPASGQVVVFGEND
ncbi:MAG: hypothetical protein OZ948_05415 [Deltaproteobacteria bacterium]|nr:hypothetical protein [Deltaproteobacteria bacterium]